MLLTFENINRRLFTLFRTHSLPIKNNLLRWNIANNNLCEMCNGIFVENEFHILFRCSKYKNIREKFIPVNLRSNPNIQTLHTILATSDTSLIKKNIVRFLNEILRERVK